MHVKLASETNKVSNALFTALLFRVLCKQIEREARSVCHVAKSLGCGELRMSVEKTVNETIKDMV